MISQTTHLIASALFAMTTVAGFTNRRQAMVAAVAVLQAISIRDALAVVSAAGFADTAAWDRSLFGTVTTVAVIFAMPAVSTVTVGFFVAATMVLIIDQLMQEIDRPGSNHEFLESIVMVARLGRGRSNCGNQGGGGDNTGNELGRHNVLLSGIFVSAL